MCMYDPDEGTVWPFRDDLVRARKAHRCHECRRTIRPGEQYRYFVGVGYYDPGLWIVKTCLHCSIAVEWLITACEGYPFGEALGDLREHWLESPLYHSPMLRRLIDGMATGWRDGAAPVPDVNVVRLSVPVAA